MSHTRQHQQALPPIFLAIKERNHAKLKQLLSEDPSCLYEEHEGVSPKRKISTLAYALAECVRENETKLALKIWLN